MYENPITEMIGDIAEQIVRDRENQLMYTIKQELGFSVDKQELLRALQYDREQYTKGYKDCKAEMLDKVKQAREEIDNLTYAESYIEPYSVIYDVLKIIDKLIESEGVRNGK